MAQANRKKMKVTFIVNGVDVVIEMTGNQFLKTGRNGALRASNNDGRPPDDWELHTDAGKPLNPNKSLEKLGISDGARLFINLKVGFGGSRKKCQSTNEYDDIVSCFESMVCSALGVPRWLLGHPWGQNEGR